MSASAISIDTVMQDIENILVHSESFGISSGTSSVSSISAGNTWPPRSGIVISLEAFIIFLVSLPSGTTVVHHCVRHQSSSCVDPGCNTWRLEVDGHSAWVDHQPPQHPHRRLEEVAEEVNGMEVKRSEDIKDIRNIKNVAQVSVDAVDPFFGCLHIGELLFDAQDYIKETAEDEDMCFSILIQIEQEADEENEAYDAFGVKKQALILPMLPRLTHLSPRERYHVDDVLGLPTAPTKYEEKDRDNCAMDSGLRSDSNSSLGSALGTNIGMDVDMYMYNVMDTGSNWLVTPNLALSSTSTSASTSVLASNTGTTGVPSFSFPSTISGLPCPHCKIMFLNASGLSLHRPGTSAMCQKNQKTRHLSSLYSAALGGYPCPDCTVVFKTTATIVLHRPGESSTCANNQRKLNITKKGPGLRLDLASTSSSSDSASDLPSTGVAGNQKKEGVLDAEAGGEGSAEGQAGPSGVGKAPKTKYRPSGTKATKAERNEQRDMWRTDRRAT